MTVKDLIKILVDCEQDKEILIIDYIGEEGEVDCVHEEENGVYIEMS